MAGWSVGAPGDWGGTVSARRADAPRRATPTPRDVHHSIGVIAETLTSGHDDRALRIARGLGPDALGAVAGLPSAQARVREALAVAETLFVGGCTRDASTWCAAAEWSASEAGAPELLVEAQGLRAAILAVSGESMEAEGVIAETRRVLRDLEPAAAGVVSWPLILAEATTVMNRRTGRDVRPLIDEARDLDPALDWIAPGLVRLLETMQHMLHGERRQVVDASEGCRGSGSPGCPRYLRDVILSHTARSYVVLGDPGRALDLLAEAASPGDHPVCLSVDRASAYLAAGRPAEALACTESCVRSPEHMQRPLRALHVRRAIALEMQGRPAAADREFARSWYSAIVTGSVRPVVGVPEKEYRALEARFRERHPDVVDTLADYAVFAEAVHPVEGVGDLGMLGQREREVGGLLVGGGTSAQIAATLGISVNTVKTHTRAIYAKLGVHTRTAAVDELRRLGLGARESSGEGRR